MSAPGPIGPSPDGDDDPGALRGLLWSLVLGLLFWVVAGLVWLAIDRPVPW